MNAIARTDRKLNGRGPGRGPARPHRPRHPRADGEQLHRIFVGGAVTAALAMVLIAFSRPRRAAIESVEARYESRAMNHEWG